MLPPGPALADTVLPMAAARYVLGIDIGTGGARAVLLSLDEGTIAGTHTATYDTRRPHPGWSEQSATDWWQATCEAVRGVLNGSGASGEDVACVGVTGQMHGLVALDAQEQPVRPAILWNDQRTADQCAQMHDVIGEARLIEWTGKPALTSFTAPKLLWLREHEPDCFDRIAHVLLPKDAVRHQLCGEQAIDVTDASGTSLLNVHTRHWCADILEALDLPATWLPPVLESAAVAGAITAAAANETGLRQGTPIVAGAGDQAAAGVACGISEPEIVSINLGTSGVLFAACQGAPIDSTGGLHTFCHAIPGTCHLMGCMLSAGGCLEWFRDVIAPDATYAQLIEEAMNIPAGSEGLHFYPYLTGERTPHNDPTLTASFRGLTARHGRAHLVRAVLEGITYGLRDGLDLLGASGQQIDRIRLTGGGAKSASWQALAADIFDAPVCTMQANQGSAHGAAILAMVGGERYDSVPEAMAACISEHSQYEPTRQSGIYTELHQQWKDGSA